MEFSRPTGNTVPVSAWPHLKTVTHKTEALSRIGSWRLSLIMEADS